MEIVHSLKLIDYPHEQRPPTVKLLLISKTIHCRYGAVNKIANEFDNKKGPNVLRQDFFY